MFLFRFKNTPVFHILVVLTIVELNLIKPNNCDHLQQTNDETSREQQQEHPQSTSEQERNQRLIEPENLKRALKELIMLRVDGDQDGYVSYEEIKKYLAELHEKTIEFNVNKQWLMYQPQIHEVFSWEGYEPERKEVLTWDHYFNQTYPELIGVDVGIPINREQDTSRILNPAEGSSESDDRKEDKVKVNKDTEGDLDPQYKSLKLMVLRADARWKLADENGDTLLTKDEFKFLLHPDEGNEELQNLFVHEATEDMDINKDGKICLDEFMKHLQVLASDQERNDQNWLSSQQENFGRFLDKDKDGVLNSDEIRDWLVPAKSKKFEVEAKRLFDVGDSNEDHKLSYAEILENYEQYTSLLSPEYWRDLQDDDRYQDGDSNLTGDGGATGHEEL